jgi:aspartate aminotransferase-like enzyme/GNAT superfamily N-acetyltransferase
MTGIAHRPPVKPGEVRLATAQDADAIHRLNYRTFVEEIPQYDPNPDEQLVDRFHDENTYAVYEVDGTIVGMVAARTQRPFSLDQKIPGMDRLLPPFRKAVEFRMLAVDREHRNGRVFTALVRFIVDHFASEGYDLGLISGTTRQLRLYRHLGYQPFGPLVGRDGAWYQPMYITLATLAEWSAALRPDCGGNLLPGPVAVARHVHEAFVEAPVSHRACAFQSLYDETAQALRDLTGATHATMLLGSGTLANDCIAAQLSLLGERGTILVNGEFGERLVDHATRMQLRFDVVRAPRGEAFDVAEVERCVQASSTGWLWFVHCETSTGVLNDLPAMASVTRLHGVRLAVDAISSVGSVPVDLSGAWIASSVSGKALAAYPGLAVVFHDGHATPSGRLPRYLDLGYAHVHGGVPFTHSSNLLRALSAAVSGMDWAERFERIARDSRALRRGLAAHGLYVLADEAVGSPAVHTIPLPPTVSSTRVGEQLRGFGWQVSFESGYLTERNWIQACLMGVLEDGAVGQFVERLAKILRGESAGSSRTGT